MKLKLAVISQGATKKAHWTKNPKGRFKQKLGLKNKMESLLNKNPTRIVQAKVKAQKKTFWNYVWLDPPKRVRRQSNLKY